MPVDPTKLTIVNYPAHVLLERAGPVEAVTPEIAAIARRMIELMHEAEGVGLAAPQVGLPLRMFVADVPPTDGRSPEPGPAGPASATTGPEVYINPRLSDFQGEPQAADEGCLSLPGIRGDVVRPPTVTITAMDLSGRSFTKTASGLLARCWQHECDHLDGILILERFTPPSRAKNRPLVKVLEKNFPR